MVVTTEERARLDPYSRVAESKNVPLLQNIAGSHLIALASHVTHYLVLQTCRKWSTQRKPGCWLLVIATVIFILVQ